MATVKFIQAQKFSLSGSGSSIGDTSITLQSMLGIDGVALVTADIGVKGFGTLEPGNGIQEEQISFTGITQNANGTATLTGVKTVAFISPYTETSGLAKTHAGASTFILSNDAGFYGQILSYVDTALSSGAIPATTLVNGISTLSIAPASAAQPVVVGTNDPRMLTQTEKNYVASVVPTAIPYVVAAGTASAFTATLASSISTLASGTFLHFLVPVTNATGVTLNVNSLGAKPIKKNVSTTLASGDITIGQVAEVVYDGTNFQLTSTPSILPGVSGGQSTRDLATANGSFTVAHGLGVTPRMVRITAQFADTGSFSQATAIYFASTQSSITLAGDLGSGTGNGGTIDNEFRLYATAIGNSVYSAWTIAVSATNITITTSKSGSPTGTAHFIWEAYV